MDSSASFKERARAIGLPEAGITSLADNNLATFGQFAVLSSFSPGAGDAKPFVDARVKVLRVAPSEGELAGWRRLFYESHTLTMSDLRGRLDRKDDETPRKLMMPERVERLERCRKNLPGITIDTQMEPAHRLLNQTVQQAEESTIKYIPIHECLSCEAELLHSKTEHAIEFLPDGTMKLSKKQQEIRTEVMGELKVRMAMQQRALAYHIAGLLDFQKIGCHYSAHVCSDVKGACRRVPCSLSAAGHPSRP